MMSHEARSIVVAAVVLLSLLRRRALPGAPEGDGSTVPDNWFWLRLSAVSIVVMGAVMWLCVIAFALAEALGQHSYGWLLLLPFGLWGLRRQVPAIGKLWRADPSAGHNLDLICAEPNFVTSRV